MSNVKTTGWVGWGWFAATILLLSGIFSATQGLVALFGPDTYFVSTDAGLFVLDVAGWGWWNLIVGILLMITALALFTGAMWSRVVAIVLAVISAVGQLFLLPAQPWWAMIIIAVDVLVIYALTAHGEEMRR